MVYILHIQNLPDGANNLDIRRRFSHLHIPEGGVQIVGGPNGDAFVDFTKEEDLLQALAMEGEPLLGIPLKFFLAREEDKEAVIGAATAESYNRSRESPPRISANLFLPKSVRDHSPTLKRSRRGTPPWLKQPDRYDEEDREFEVDEKRRKKNNQRSYRLDERDRDARWERDDRSEKRRSSVDRDYDYYKGRGERRQRSPDREWDRDRYRERDRSTERHSSRSPHRDRESYRDRYDRRPESSERERGRTRYRDDDRESERYSSADSDRRREPRESGRYAQEQKGRERERESPHETRQDPTKQVSQNKTQKDPNSVVLTNVAATVNLHNLREFLYGFAIAKDGITIKSDEINPHLVTAEINFIYPEDIPRVRLLNGKILHGLPIFVQTTKVQEHPGADDASRTKPGPATAFGSQHHPPAEGHDSHRPLPPHFPHQSNPNAPKHPAAAPHGPPPRGPHGGPMHGPGPNHLVMLPDRHSIVSWMLTPNRPPLHYVVHYDMHPRIPVVELWNKFGGPSGPAQGVVLVRNPQGAAIGAIIGFLSVEARNRTGKKGDPRFLRFSQPASARRLVDYYMEWNTLIEATLTGRERLVTEDEMNRLEAIFPLGRTPRPGLLPVPPKQPGAPAQPSSTRPPHPTPSPVSKAQPQQKGLPAIPSSSSPVKLLSAEDKKRVYLCLSRLKTGTTATDVWRWFGGFRGLAGVTLVTAHIPKGSQDEGFMTAFVVFNNPDEADIKVLMAKHAHSKKYSFQATLRFLTRIPDYCIIYQTKRPGADHELSCEDRALLKKVAQEEKYIDIMNISIEDQFSICTVTGVQYVQDSDVSKAVGASSLLAEYKKESSYVRGVVLICEHHGTPVTAYIAFGEIKSCNSAVEKNPDKRKGKSAQNTVFMLANAMKEGKTIHVSTGSGKDRSLRPTERAFLMKKLLEDSTAKTKVIELDKPVKEVKPVGASEAKELFYLRIRKVAPEMTACDLYENIEGAKRKSKGVTLAKAASTENSFAYVTFEKEADRDAAADIPYAKKCTSQAREMRLAELGPEFTILESTAEGKDRVLR